MNVGVIARVDDRGLGTMTTRIARAYATRVLAIDAGRWSPFPQHLDRLPGATVARWDQHQQLDEATVREWLAGLDVVYTAETLYDWRIVEWASDAGARLVVHVMPELLRPDWAAIPGITWWAPTGWLRATLPAGHRVVPVPGPDPRRGEPEATGDRVRFLHVAGHTAAGDRNGTFAVYEAARRLTVGCDVEIQSQDGRADFTNVAPAVALSTRGPVDDPAGIYAGHDVLVMPRRYGGLCLPVLEAMAAGLAVVMPECPPNDEWPTCRFPVSRWTRMRTPAGEVPVAIPSTSGLVEVLDALARDPAGVDEARIAARLFAETNTVDALRPVYVDEFALAAGL